LDRWNEAIAGLDALPPTSEFYRFAQKKVQEYRQNVSIVNERLTTEKTAVEDLALAQEAAKVAEVRLSIAQSLPDLQLAYRTWQTAIDALSKIPPATTPFPEARRLLGLYQPKLKEARDRQTQETFATNAYNKAIRLADQAQAAANQNRWSEAINAWNQAIASLKQIPRDSFNAVQAQPLVETYSDALSRAESRLEGSLQLQQAQTDLGNVCRLNDRQICVYTVTSSKITVRLTPAYVEQVRQTSEQARSQNNLEAQVDVLDHVFALEQTLERISDRAGIPLDIYTTNNILVKSHTPN
jgi:tetratricopeptide (TPR) repeat protein